MDRNSIIGLSLIGLIIIAYSIFTQPSPEEIKELQRRKDSIQLVEEQNKIAIAQQQAIVSADTVVIQSDSAKQEYNKQNLGDFASAATGTEQLITLENKHLKIVLSSLGGKIKKAELKGYKTWDGKPLLLLNSDSSIFNISFSAQNRIINTSDLYFNASGTTGSVKSVSLRLPAGDQK